MRKAAGEMDPEIEVGAILHVRYADGTEDVNRAGDLYYWPGGHTAWTDEGVVFVEFSPTEELRPVLDHVGAALSMARARLPRSA